MVDNISLFRAREISSEYFHNSAVNKISSYSRQTFSLRQRFSSCKKNPVGWYFFTSCGENYRSCYRWSGSRFLLRPTIIDGTPVILIFHNGRALFTFFLIFYFLPFQRPSAASARQRARRAGSLVTASSSRMSRPSRLTGARTWRWVHCPPLRLIVKTLPNSTGSADRLPSFPPLLREFFGNFCRLQFFFFCEDRKFNENELFSSLLLISIYVLIQVSTSFPQNFTLS